MNINDLKPGSYSVISQPKQPLNIKNLPADSTTPVSLTSMATTPQSSSDKVSSFFGQIGSAFKSGVAQIGKGFHENPIEGIGDIGAGAIQAVTSPAAPILNATVGAGINAVADKISNNPTVQKFANSKAGAVTSRVAQDVQNYSTIGGAVVGGAEAEPKISDLAESAKSAIKGSPADIAAKAATDRETSAIQDVTPNFNKKLISEPDIKYPDTTNEDGTVTPGKVVKRVSEGGLTSGRSVNSTILEQEAGKTLAKVPEYDPKATDLENYQKIEPEIAKQGANLRTSLAAENVVRSPKNVMGVITKAVNGASEDSLLLQKGDPTVANYLRVAQRAVSQSTPTLDGELAVRQSMDNAYENARGKLAYGSDKLSALDEIHTAARDALNQDIMDNAKSTDVKAALKSQWDLYRASDALRSKAEIEAGTTLERLQQKYPITASLLTKGAKTAAAGAGLGAIIH